MPLSRTPRHTLKVPVRWPHHGRWHEQLLHAFAVGWPIGLVPWVPATLASAVTAVLCWLLAPHTGTLGLVVFGLFLLGSWSATVSERLLESADPRNVVIDEIAGQALAFLGFTPMHWPRALAGFVLFRVFDVLKPFPARAAERLPGGWGIMADDLIAGLYAAFGLWLLRRWVV